MFCKSCGFRNSEEAQFCQNCGKPLDKVQPTVNPQPTMPQQSTPTQQPITQQPVQPQQGYQQQAPNYNYQAVNNNQYENNAQMYAILGLVIPIAAFLISWFIGIGLIWSILLAGLGFEFSRRGESYNKTLSTIGKILSIVYVVFAIAIFVLIVIGTISSVSSAI